MTKGDLFSDVFFTFCFMGVIAGMILFFIGISLDNFEIILLGSFVWIASLLPFAGWLFP
jgi:hypothetical protein